MIQSTCSGTSSGGEPTGVSSPKVTRTKSPAASAPGAEIVLAHDCPGSSASGGSGSYARARRIAGRSSSLFRSLDLVEIARREQHHAELPVGHGTLVADPPRDVGLVRDADRRLPAALGDGEGVDGEHEPRCLGRERLAPARAPPTAAARASRRGWARPRPRSRTARGAPGRRARGGAWRSCSHTLAGSLAGPMDLYEYQGKELFRRVGIPVSEGRLAVNPAEARGGGAAARVPGRRQGPGADRRPRQGGRHQARREPRPRRRSARRRSSASTSAATSCASSGSRRRPTSSASTTSRSPSTAGRRSRSSCSRPRAASRSSRWPKRARTRSSSCTSTRSRASIRGRRGASSTAPGVTDPGEQKQIAAIVGRLYEAFVGFDAMLCEINPLIVTPSGEVKALDSKFTVDDNALFRHPDVAEMRDAAAADPLESLAREKQRHVREARRRGRRARERRGADDVDGRRRHLRGRATRELLRPRRRRRRAGRRRRALRDHARPAGEGDLLQHLRRHHALRRGRARDPAGARRDVARPAHRRPARRHERGGGAQRSSPTPPRRTSTSRRRCSRRPERRSSSRDERRVVAAGRGVRRLGRRIARARTSTSSSTGPTAPRRRSTSPPAAATSPGGCARRASRS